MAMKPFALGLALVLACSGTQQALAALTGQYLFEDNTLDTSGNARHGSAVGGPTFTSGLYMGSTSALQFNGTNQSVQLPDNTDFVRNAPGATLMAWVQPSALPSGAHTIFVVNNADAASGGTLGAARANIQINGSQFRVLGRQDDSGGSSSFSGGTAVAGTTHFVTGVFDYVGSAVRLYLDGQPVGSTTVAGWTANSADTANLVARIGANFNGTGEYFGGIIDGARVFNTALTAQEILDIYNAESFAPPLPGDTDGNGIVEPQDLTPIRTNWRMTGMTRMQGNLSGDAAGLVDFADFRQWKTAFLGGGGSLEGIDLSFTAVPEPNVLILLASIAASFAAGSCRKRQ